MAIFGDNNPNFLIDLNSPTAIFGFGGNDTLIGGGGNDSMSGGAGSDTASCVTSLAAVQVDLGGINTGGDAQGDVMNSIEDVTGSRFADRISGNGLSNVLDGFGGADTLIGGGGADTLLGGGGADLLNGGSGGDRMIGGAGNDIYVYDNAFDIVSELTGTGSDTVLSNRDIDLGSVQFIGDIENVILTGTADLDATGNDLANTLRGNAGDNEIDGGLGFDRMVGGGGDDTYVVNSAGDVVVESAAGTGGEDLVVSAVTFNLRGAQFAGTQTAVENLILSGNAAINGFGNNIDNILVGNSGSNVLAGFAGNDALLGGGGADTFQFRSALNANANVDTILDFNVAQDSIELENLFMTALGTGALDADAFRIGAAAADAEDRIIYNAANGSLSYDADGAGGAAAIRFAILDPGHALTNADIFVF